MTFPADKTLLLLGGTSDIGRATALAFAERGWAIQLAGRASDALDREADHIRARTGVAVSTHPFDALEPETFAVVLDGLPVLPGVAVCAVGLLGDQTRAEADPTEARLILRSNFEGPAIALGLVAERFLARGTGTIVGISSVAGDRGRATNYAYGSAKAGFTAFLSGLRNRCARQGVHVVTVKPGFVRSRMTAAMALPAPLTTTPDVVARAILRAVDRKRDVLYVKARWGLVMTLIRLIPERLFKGMRL